MLCSTSVLSFYLDVVLTLSITIRCPIHRWIKIHYIHSLSIWCFIVSFNPAWGTSPNCISIKLIGLKSSVIKTQPLSFHDESLSTICLAPKMYFPQGMPMRVIELKLHKSFATAFMIEIYVEWIETWISWKARIKLLTDGNPISTTAKWPTICIYIFKFDIRENNFLLFWIVSHLNA